jgi:hypothetical protein
MDMDVESCFACGAWLPATRSVRYVVKYDHAHGCVIDPEAEPAHGRWGFEEIGGECLGYLPRLAVVVQSDEGEGEGEDEDVSHDPER